MKTFEDFFAIARASRSYLLVGPGMYRSTFLETRRPGRRPFIFRNSV